MSPIIYVIATAVIVAAITWFLAVAYRKKSYESKRRGKIQRNNR